MVPMVPECDTAPATIPARYAPSEKANCTDATLSAVFAPDVMTNAVFGNDGATRIAGSWYSKPWPNTRLYPWLAYCRKFSSISAGVWVCTFEMWAPSESRMRRRPRYAPAFQPWSDTEPVVTSATLKSFEVDWGWSTAFPQPIIEVATSMWKPVDNVSVRFRP